MGLALLASRRMTLGAGHIEIKRISNFGHRIPAAPLEPRGIRPAETRLPSTPSQTRPPRDETGASQARDQNLSDRQNHKRRVQAVEPRTGAVLTPRTSSRIVCTGWSATGQAPMVRGEITAGPPT